MFEEIDKIIDKECCRLGKKSNEQLIMLALSRIIVKYDLPEERALQEMLRRRAGE